MGSNNRGLTSPGIPSRLNFPPLTAQTQGIPLTVNSYGDSVDGSVAVPAAAASAAAVFTPPLSHALTSDDLIDLTVHSQYGCCHSANHFEDRTSFNPVLSLPSSPPLLSMANVPSLNSGRREGGDGLEPIESRSLYDTQVPDANSPLDLSMKPQAALSDPPDFNLVDAGVAHSKRLLRKVEDFLDAAVCLFAAPLDLYTAPRNILFEEDVAEAEAMAAASVVAEKVREIAAVETVNKEKIEGQATGSTEMRANMMDSLTASFALSDFYRSLPLAEPSFSPVFRHLLCLPEWKALAFLRYPTARGKELADQLASVGKNLAQCKRKLKQINLVQRRRAAAGQASSPQTVKLPPPQSPLFPNSYTDPNVCPLSLLSLVFDKKGDEPNPPSHISQISPLSVDTEILSETAKVRPLSDIGPRAWVAASPPPPPPPVRAQGPATMRNRSFSFPKRPATPLPTPSIDRRKLKGQIGAAPTAVTTPACVWTPKRRRSEISQPGRIESHSRHISESMDSCEAVSDISMSPLRLHDQLTIQVKETDPQHNPSVYHSVKTTASLSPSTSSLATVDTSSASSFHQSQQHPLPSSSSSSRRRRKVSLGHSTAPPPTCHASRLDQALEEVEDELLQRPPTPDLRRIDLDLSDLSNGLRVLLIEDTHLRAGTLYLEDTSPPYTGERDNSHARLCLIRLDHLEKVESPPIRSGLGAGAGAGSGSSGGGGGGGGSGVLFTSCAKRRRLGEVRLEAWQVLQQAVLEVVPVSMRQLPPGTRVCAAWSDTLANNLYPGAISAFDATKPPPAKDCLYIDFDDGDHREVPLHRIRMLPDHFANLNQFGRAACATTYINAVEVRRSQTSPQPPPVSPKIRRRVSTTRRCSLVNGSASSLKEVSSIEHDNWLDNRCADEGKARAPPTVIWKPHGRLRKKYNGMPCYRSLKRNRDGLVVRLGDAVKFNSGGSDQAYLGEIKFICAPRHDELSPLVCASWFYCPEEAGEDGKRVAGYEGAVFLTDHMDDNEATCIINRVQIAQNYSEYRLARQRKNTKSPSSKVLTEVREERVPSEDDLSSISDSDESNSEGELPTYFVAGKFDPLTGRVIAWDPEISAELHLPSSPPPTSPQPH